MKEYQSITLQNKCRNAAAVWGVQFSNVYNIR